MTTSICIGWVGATLACLREAASAKAGRPKGRLKPPLPNIYSPREENFQSFKGVWGELKNVDNR